MTDKGNRGAGSAKPAGEPRPHWTLEDFDDATMTVVELREDGRFRAHVLRDAAERIVAALNTAETRAAQPGDAPRWIPEDVRDLLNAASKHSRNLGEYWNKVTDALNAAETRAAQPPDYAKIIAEDDATLKLMQDKRQTEENAAIAELEGIIRALRTELNEAHRALTRAAQPGDAPKLTGEDFWGSLRLDRYGSIVTAETLDALNALLASRSTQAAPAATSPALSPDAAASSGDDKGEGR